MVNMYCKTNAFTMRSLFARSLHTTASTAATTTTTASTAPFLTCTTSLLSTYDVVVVGGGLVGGVFACLMRSSLFLRSLSLLVVEPTSTPAVPPPSSPPLARVLTLTPASVRLLAVAGMRESWQRGDRVKAFDEMKVWQPGTIGRIHWKAREMEATERERGSGSGSGDEQAVLGYTVENDMLVNALHEKLRHHSLQSIQYEIERSQKSRMHDRRVEARCDLLQDVKVERVSLPDDSTHDLNSLVLSDGRTITCKLIIGSDGAGSQVRKAGLMGDFGFDYQQKAIVSTLKMEHNSGTTAWQVFLPTGPVALLPCHTNYMSLVWSTNTAHERYLCDLTPDRFVSEINAAFAESREDGDSKFTNFLPGPIRRSLPILFPRDGYEPPLVRALVSDRYSLPLRLSLPLRYVRSRCALIGDAAHVVHPLAGQGVNLGLADAEALIRLMEDDIREGGDGFSPVNVLEAYERERMIANSLSLAGIDSLQKFFAARYGIIPLLRGIGMEAFNASSALKYAVAKAAINSTRLV